MSKVGIRKKALRKEVEFEYNPPRCTNCNNFKPPLYGVPGQKFYRAPHCTLHEFQVKPHSICNAWVGRAGEVLEVA
jgi:hypothetical protein